MRRLKHISLDLVQNLFASRKGIHFITDGADWVIKSIGKSLQTHLLSHTAFHIATSTQFLKHSTIHFGTVATLIKGEKILLPHTSNRNILTWFHIEPDDSRIKYIPALNTKIAKVHTASSISKTQLITHGFDEEKIHTIPLGIDTTHFYPFTKEKRHEIRQHLGIPDGVHVIGSFQKDGNGWGEGLTPKYVKGPDIFCDVVESLVKQFPIHILLTGPARGYVKKQLEDKNIPYTHVYVDTYEQMVEYYNALDLYIIGSRVEGGPMALLESWACGVPVVSTKVGMAVDIMRHGENGYIVDVEDVEGLSHYASILLDSLDARVSLIDQGLRDIAFYDWSLLSQRYFDELYRDDSTKV